MNVRIYLITDAIVSIVDTRLRLPTKTPLKGIQTGNAIWTLLRMVGPRSPPHVGGLDTFARTS